MLAVSMYLDHTHEAGKILIKRGGPHSRLPHHFWYSYRAVDDENNRYEGRVLHNYESSVFALTQKVTRAIVAQQKAAKNNKSLKGES